MDAYLITVIAAVIAGLCGVFIGWRWQDRRYQKLVSQLQLESGDQSLKLLETRKHLRTISSHLKASISKDQTIRQLKRKQRSLLKRIDQQTLQARRQEKAHYIELAKIKLELIETKLADGVSTETAAKNSTAEPARSNDDLKKLLRHAGIQKMQQIASLSRRDIDRLASQKESVSAE